MSDLFTLTPEQKARWHADMETRRRGGGEPSAPRAVEGPGRSGEKWSLQRPSLEVCRRRFIKETDGLGRPFWLPIYNWLHPPEDEGMAGHPAGCAGPYQKQGVSPRRSRFPCGKVHFCTYCWERRRREGGLRAALYHADQDHVQKFSISLPGVRADPGRVVEARGHVWRVLRRAGFDRLTVWVHTFGENPAEGAKGHLDGIASGPEGADVGVFDVDADGRLERVLRPFHERPDAGFWQPHVHHRSAKQPTLRREVGELVRAGLYAGRPTFHARRIWAGLYGPMHDLRIRMTYTTTKRRGHRTEPLKSGGRVVADWSFEDLRDAALAAEEWRKIAGRTVMPRGVRLRPHVLDAVLADTRWRRRYRLPHDELLRDRFLS